MSVTLNIYKIWMNGKRTYMWRLNIQVANSSYVNI